MCFPREAVLLRGYRAAYADLFAKLPATTRLTVLAHPSAVADLRELLTAAGADGRARVVVAPAELEFTVWAQDPYLALADGEDGPCLLRPFFFRREGDAGIAEVLARSTQIRVKESSLCFQGGYVLVGDDFVLVGRDCLDATLETLEQDYATPVPAGRDRVEFAAEVFREGLDPSRRVVFVGTDLPVPSEVKRAIVINGSEKIEFAHGDSGRAQPLGHLDMFVSLAGRGESGSYRLLVGSPALADRLLGRPPLEYAVAALFDDVAEKLAEQGFEVIRNPLPLTYADGRRSVEGEERDVRIWYFASSNNCLVQIDEREGNHVWLPTYGHGAWKELAATDEANGRIWAELGFTVHQLTSFHAFAQRLGAVHCITKDLER